MTNITESNLFHQLMHNPDFAQDILRNHGIVTRVSALGKSLAGMVYRSTNNTYYIIANQILDFEQQRIVFLHELAHILIDAPQQPYMLSLDITDAEMVADRTAIEAYNALAKCNS